MNKLPLSPTPTATSHPAEKQIYDLWLACWTDEEIGARFGLDKATVSRRIKDLLQNGMFSEMQQTFTHAADFTPPLYNICKTPYSIGKELSKWVEKLFDAKVSKETIKTRARRIQKKTEDSFGTNEPKTTERDSARNVESELRRGLAKAGKSKSESESARRIAEDTGESEESIRHRIRNGKSEVGGHRPKNPVTN